MDETRAKPRLGRPPLHGGKRMRSRSIALPVATWAALERRAKSRGVSLAALVRKMLAVGSPP